MANKRAPKKASTQGSALDPEVLVDDPEERSVSSEDSAASGPVVDIPTGATTAASPADSMSDSAASSEAVEPEPESGASSNAAIVRSIPTLPRKTRDRAASSALDAFMATVGRYPVLTAEQEKALAMEVYENNDAMAARRLVVHNLRLVVKMAYKYRRAWASVIDLIQEGNVGLVEAVRRFDPFKGARFSTYATYWIRAYMIRYLLDHSRMVKISRTRAGRKLFFRLSREREKLRALGVEPGPKLLAEKLGVSQKDFEEVSKHMDQPEVRLDAPISQHQDGGGTVLDLMADSGASPESQAHQRAFAEDVSEALESFGQTLTDEREIAAWNEHLMSDDPLSLSALGERFGVTKQRMGQIVNGIRKRLKGHLVETLGPDVELEYRGL